MRDGPPPTTRRGCEGHEDGDDDEVALDAAEQAQGQGCEEVGHLPLGQGGGAQADDGQNTEESQAQTGSDVVARRQQQGDGQDAHVDADVGGHKVSAPMARNVKGSDQEGEGHKVGADVGQCQW